MMVRGVPPTAKLLTAFLITATAIFMLVPLAVVMLSSLSASEFLVFPPRGFSLRWYGEIMASDAFR